MRERKSERERERERERIRERERNRAVSENCIGREEWEETIPE